VSDRDPRELEIDGLVNIRDIGGLVTRDGRTIRSGRVFRSDNPKALTDEGRRQFREVVNPSTVIDLRIPLEVHREGYELDEHVTVVNCPMTPQSGVNQAQIDAGMCDNLIDDYMKQIDVNGRFVAQALSLIAEGANQPVVIHCTAGKDRTGIVIAMLLDILGVAHEVIVSDYHLTTKNMAPVLERIRNAPVFKENGLADAPDWIFASDPETMRGFLTRMTATYGGAEEWALAQGLSSELLAQVRVDLVER
jgi:protein tyrosine/serine phosphatase